MSTLEGPAVQPPAFIAIERAVGELQEQLAENPDSSSQSTASSWPRTLALPFISSTNEKKSPWVPFPVGNGKAAAASFTLWESLFFKFG